MGTVRPQTTYAKPQAKGAKAMTTVTFARPRLPEGSSRP
jgi:hypothetical protein